MKVLNIGDELDINDFIEWLENGNQVKITDLAIKKVQDCYESLKILNLKEEPIYGISTGFGQFQNKWIELDKQGELQVNLIRSHAVGVGDQIDRKIVRIAMVLLLNSLTKGHSGVKLETVKLLESFINKDIMPVTYEIGSLGASGDLAPLAHIALTLIGEGEVNYEGGIMATKEVMKIMNLKPLKLEAKEGLALINGTHFVTAYAVELFRRSKHLILTSLMGASLSLEALRGTDVPYDENIANLRRHHGHKMVAMIMRQMLKNSKNIKSHSHHSSHEKTQDPYSLRCLPQVVGAVWDGFGYLEKTLNVEINSVTDNPLLFVSEDKVLSGGNFHAEPLGLPLEMVIIGLIEIANIAEARVSKLVDPYVDELPSFLAGKPGLESGYMIAHYTVASLLNKLRGLGMPNLVDNIHVSGGQEDHVSMAMNTATRSMKVLEMVEDIIIFEIMMAVRGLNLVQHDELSLYLSNMLNFINEKIEFIVDDHVIRNVFVDYKELMVMEKYKDILNNFENYPKSFL